MVLISESVILPIAAAAAVVQDCAAAQREDEEGTATYATSSDVASTLVEFIILEEDMGIVAPRSSGKDCCVSCCCCGCCCLGSSLNLEEFNALMSEAIQLLRVLLANSTPLPELVEVVEDKEESSVILSSSLSLPLSFSAVLFKTEWFAGGTSVPK